MAPPVRPPPQADDLQGFRSNGVTIQVYLALIASLIISLWTGHKPTKRTYEMCCHYFSGWASVEEMQAHIDKLRQKTADST